MPDVNELNQQAVTLCPPQSLPIFKWVGDDIPNRECSSNIIGRQFKSREIALAHALALQEKGEDRLLITTQRRWFVRYWRVEQYYSSWGWDIDLWVNRR